MFQYILFLCYNLIGDNMDLILVLCIILLPLIAEVKIKSSYNKYLKIDNSKNLTGKEVARMILDKNGLNNISVSEVRGVLTDHYNPSTKNINLSAPIYNQQSIASISVAAHECGHAIQDKDNYYFLKFRSKLVPIVNITSRISTIFVMLGFFLEFLELIEVGIVLLLCGLLFQLVTLPVEFDASKRAKAQLQELGFINKDEVVGIKKVLNSAAFTYVAGFLAEALQILRLILISRRRD